MLQGDPLQNNSTPMIMILNGTVKLEGNQLYTDVLCYVETKALVITYSQA